MLPVVSGRICLPVVWISHGLETAASADPLTVGVAFLVPFTVVSWDHRMPGGRPRRVAPYFFCWFLLKLGIKLMNFLSVLPFMKRDFPEGRGVVKGDRGKVVWRGSGEMCCRCGGECCERGDVRRCVSTRITFWGWLMSNVAETSGFSHAAVCFVPGLHLNQYCSRARRATAEDHGEWRGGVKVFLFTEKGTFFTAD
ncbi:hypothetical protein Pan241w_16780 [Gimesia alba]|uniref:Uncharacterized protein n=1 Tax=Gimesia alba TaxID=2527973 RepID=A0A517RCL4_9PLAN|nr:hypothetical protein Pan241w_16780 [Gimesia alba]